MYSAREERHTPAGIVEGDEKSVDNAGLIVKELDDAVDFFIDTLNYGRERQVASNGDAACDINDDESMEIRIYLGNVAQEESGSIPRS